MCSSWSQGSCGGPLPWGGVRRGRANGEIEDMSVGRKARQGVRKQSEAWPPAQVGGKLRGPEDSLSAPEPVPPGSGQKAGTKDHGRSPVHPSPREDITCVTHSVHLPGSGYSVWLGQLCPPPGLGEGQGALPSPRQLPTS